MKITYLDLHIHTSDNPNSLNTNYDLDTLVSKVEDLALSKDYLISFTDHNSINEKVYLEAQEKIPGKFLVGVELHVRPYSNKEAYHCHIYFDFDLKPVEEKDLKDIKGILDSFYKEKLPKKDDEKIPYLHDLVSAFEDKYKFLLLPHGGQSHASFDTTTPKDKKFDNLLENSIYYNFFDGFTSRSERGTDKTLKYLETMGMSEFVNLITCSDNYDPSIYPQSKNHSDEKSPFVPTWMFAESTFSGLRLSLSDRSRFDYSTKKPEPWKDSIRKVKLIKDNIDINITFSEGLNVIIGESSSGKTLLVDSLYRKSKNESFDESVYEGRFEVKDLEVENLDSNLPHFISQSFINDVVNKKKDINKIDLIKKILPNIEISEQKEIDNALESLRDDLNSLFLSIKNIEQNQKDLKAFPSITRLISSQKGKINILDSFYKNTKSFKKSAYTKFEKVADIQNLKKIDNKLSKNPFIDHNKNLTKELIEELEKMEGYSLVEEKFVNVVNQHRNDLEELIKKEEGEDRKKKIRFSSLLSKMEDYYKNIRLFEETLKNISAYKKEVSSKDKYLAGCKLSAHNTFSLTRDDLLKGLNHFLPKDKQIDSFDEIIPEKLFESNFKDNSKGSKAITGSTYESVKNGIFTGFMENNKTEYKIIRPDGLDYDNLSPGLKAATILELILNSEDDEATLIIDQPEDNLAVSYINEGLVKSVKHMKSKKQVIFVSHNATIPMTGDAQNIILCSNIKGKIVIRSSPLEGYIGKRPILDWIASITDGGKSSIKKRFKKYNIKTFRN